MAKLTPKHYQALELIEEGVLTYTDVAKTMGWDLAHLHQLMTGNTKKAGEVATLFNTEVQKITKRNQDKIKDLSADARRLALQKCCDFLRNSGKKVDAKTMKEVTRMMNSIGKMLPKGPKSVSFSYTNHFSPQEMVSEYKRLKSIARSTLNGTGVHGITEGRAGAVSGTDSEGDKVSEKP